MLCKLSTPQHTTGRRLTGWCVLQLLLLWSFCTSTHAVLQGTITKCTNEGEEINITGITDDPCIGCFCRNGQVECEKTKCRNLEGCHAILFDGPNVKCCEVCKGCQYRGKTYESGQTWSDPKKPCTNLECRAGIITRSKTQCHVPCRNPIKTKGQCCPSCQGCFYEGKEYKNGATFSLKNDPCVQCTCQGGSVTCTKRACPVLNCPPDSVYTPEGECCPRCRGMREIFDLKIGCLFAKSVHREGALFQPDQCTNCTCQKGTSVCTRKSCPPLDCPESEQVPEEDGCCKICPPKRDCRFQEKGYKHSEEWRPSLCTHCMCDDGVTYCQRERCSNSLWCPKGYRLKFEPGACCPKCVEQDAVCTVFGDPHYRTFDGKMFNFQGTCKYLLAKDCSMERSFQIKVKNGVRLSSGFAWTQMLVVLIGRTRVSLLQNLVVKVNKKRISLPYTEPNVFTIRRDGHSVTLKADLGLKVVWDGDSYLEVTVSSKFKNNMCGLCGNYNGDESDDLVGKKGKVFTKGEEFGHTWRIGSKKACKVKPKLRRLKSPCESNPQAKMRANRHCSAFYGRAFSKCRRQVDVQPYVKSCVTDMCDCPPGHQCACESLRAYAQQCKRSGFKVNWEKDSTCKADTMCPKGSIFTMCASACPRTCQSRNKSEVCFKKCQPGCQCEKGTVLHNNKCIRPRKCPK